MHIIWAVSRYNVFWTPSNIVIHVSMTWNLWKLLQYSVANERLYQSYNTTMCHCMPFVNIFMQSHRTKMSCWSFSTGFFFRMICFVLPNKCIRIHCRHTLCWDLTRAPDHEINWWYPAIFREISAAISKLTSENILCLSRMTLWPVVCLLSDWERMFISFLFVWRYRIYITIATTHVPPVAHKKLQTSFV